MARAVRAIRTGSTRLAWWARQVSEGPSTWVRQHTVRTLQLMSESLVAWGFDFLEPAALPFGEENWLEGALGSRSTSGVLSSRWGASDMMFAAGSADEVAGRGMLKQKQVARAQQTGTRCRQSRGGGDEDVACRRCFCCVRARESTRAAWTR